MHLCPSASGARVTKNNTVATKATATQLLGRNPTMHLRARLRAGMRCDEEEPKSSATPVLNHSKIRNLVRQNEFRCLFLYMDAFQSQKVANIVVDATVSSCQGLVLKRMRFFQASKRAQRRPLIVSKHLRNPNLRYPRRTHPYARGHARIHYAGNDNDHSHDHDHDH